MIHTGLAKNLTDKKQPTPLLEPKAAFSHLTKGATLSAREPLHRKMFLYGSQVWLPPGESSPRNGLDGMSPNTPSDHTKRKGILLQNRPTLLNAPLCVVWEVPRLNMKWTVVGTSSISLRNQNIACRSPRIDLRNPHTGLWNTIDHSVTFNSWLRHCIRYCIR